MFTHYDIPFQFHKFPSKKTLKIYSPEDCVAHVPVGLSQEAGQSDTQSEYTELGGQMLETTVLSRNVNLSHWNCPLRHVLEIRSNAHKDSTLMKQDTLTHNLSTQS